MDQPDFADSVSDSNPFIHYLAMLDQRYEGEWKDNLQQGQGEHRFPSGHYDVAMWDQGSED